MNSESVPEIATRAIGESVTALRAEVTPLPRGWSRTARPVIEVFTPEHPEQEGSVWGYPTARSDQVMAYLGDAWLAGYERAGGLAVVAGHFVGRYLDFDAGVVVRAELLRVVAGVYVDGEPDDWEYLTSPATLVWDNGVVVYPRFDQTAREITEAKMAELQAYAASLGVEA